MTDHARMGDPRSSEDAVRAITSNRGLQALVLAAANALSPALFDDTDLTVWVETETGRRQQRNVIARARGRLEKDGEFVRYPILLERDHGKTVHFRIPQPNDCIYYPDPLGTISDEVSDPLPAHLIDPQEDRG